MQPIRTARPRSRTASRPSNPGALARCARPYSVFCLMSVTLRIGGMVVPGFSKVRVF